MELSIGRDRYSTELNEYIRAMKWRFLTIHRELELSGAHFTARLIMNKLYSAEEKRTLLSIFRKHNDDLRPLIGIEYEKRTVSCYDSCCKYMEDMIKRVYGKDDAEHIVRDNNGEPWIKKTREKGDIEFHVPLLKIPQQILDKYKDDPGCHRTGRLLPITSNQKMNDYLKEIAELCEIKKHLTTYTARRTYATTVCHESGVAIENISKMLGHTDTRTTLHYTKIADSRIKKDPQQVRDIYDR